MSLISEALNKVQQNRAEQMAFGTYAADAYSRRHKRVVHVKSYTFVWANIAVLTVFFAVALLYLRGHSSRIEPANDVTTVLGAGVQLAPVSTVQAPPPTDSPLQALSSPVPASAASAPTVEYDLAGMTVMGQNTLVSISRRSDKRSVWVPVGKSVGEIAAVSYDAELDRAVIRVGGRLLTVGMRDAAQPAE